ncbi:hypothetical protein SAMN04489760_13039 [Syntrophus gentianae]|uniref:Uncharacterized protein n=1 Tax=Syntrophus gentianae TaxID=43775 RepID=A0A1H8A6E1_9BACT|nr:hypothetical protein [Syntrophus gentianae]SEM65398.1 hypothetical protein SAMN04489760_13039 [Syntrophus gentianae]
MNGESWTKSLWIVIFLLVLCQACAPTKTFRTNPQFDTRIAAVSKPGFLPVDAKVYELGAGGIEELQDEWSAEAAKHIQGSCTECLGQKQRKVEPIVVSKEIEEELEDIQALYRAVSTSILLHTYTEPNLFPEKLNSFDYTLGPIHDLLAKVNADALIFVYAQDEISTAGRQALMATGVVLGALTGVYVVPRGGVAVISLAVVDSSGDILWFNVQSGDQYDLRKPEDVKTLVTALLADFPAGR